MVLSGIPEDPTNSDYQQFIQDVAEQGYDIVEGPDVVQPSYADLRRADYPPIEDQLDKIYHSGVNAWKAQIKAIKDSIQRYHRTHRYCSSSRLVILLSENN